MRTITNTLLRTIKTNSNITNAINSKMRGRRRRRRRWGRTGKVIFNSEGKSPSTNVHKKGTTTQSCHPS